MDRIYRSFGLTDDFPPDCQVYVQDLLKKDPCDDPQLKNYTDKPFITIDNDHSMDLDQAMHLYRANPPHMDRDEMGYCVSYALADGAYFVPAMSPLFQHALNKRGTSFYLPGKCISMLPRELSEDRMSLNEGVKRRALIFDMYLDAQGNPIKTFYCWGVIRSRWKGTYREVSEYYDAIDSGKKHSLSDKDYTETIKLLRQVGILRRKLAAGRDVCDYNRGDRSGITMNDKGMLVFSKSTHYISEDYNEQISLLCNSEGAKILSFMDSLEEETGSKDVLHPIYRSQNGPREEQVEVLQAVIRNTLAAHDLDESKRWKKESQSISGYLEDLRTYQDSFSTDSKEYRQWSAVLMVIERQAMITNVKASYSPEPDPGHHSLKMSHYARFSSPMRELVGCFTHKELFEAKKGDFQSSKMTIAGDIALRDQVIRAAVRAKFTQKKLSGAMHMHVLNVTFFKDLKKRIDHRPVYNGILMGMDFSEKNSKTRRAYVKLDEPSIEVKVYGEDLDYHYGCRYVAEGGTFGRFGTAVSIAPLPGSFAEDADDDTPPTFCAGNRVTIRVSDYARYYGQTSRSRWIFIMDIDEPIEKKRSVLRNSIVDRDLKLLLDKEEIESFGEDTIYEAQRDDAEDDSD